MNREVITSLAWGVGIVALALGATVARKLGYIDGDTVAGYVSSGQTDEYYQQVQKFLDSKGVQKRNWPERIEPIEEIPYTLSGKVKRYLLVQEVKKRLKEELDERRFI